MAASGKAQIQLELAPLLVADLLLVRGRSGDVRSTSEVLGATRNNHGSDVQRREALERLADQADPRPRRRPYRRTPPPPLARGPH
jgi:hypothetical protein